MLSSGTVAGAWTGIPLEVVILLAASDISDARLEWPPGRDEEVVGATTTGAAGANRCDSGSRTDGALRGEGSVVGGRDCGAGLDGGDDEEGCR